MDGESWTEVANGRDRKPPTDKHLDRRLLKLEATSDDEKRRMELQRELNLVRRDLAKIPQLRRVWIGTRNPKDAKGPFHVFLGGSPQKRGDEVMPANLSVFVPANPKRSRDDKAANASGFQYQLPSETSEDQRRMALANWIVHPDNPLTVRVLANRIWHYHFGTGIVDTPSDFGYMGGRPTHPELLDFLALKLKEHGWRIKPIHRMLMLSQTYRQSSTFRDQAAKVDANARLLWRFPTTPTLIRRSPRHHADSCG